MIEPRRCSSCGLPLDPPGLCPACLLKMGLTGAAATDTGLDEAGPTGFATGADAAGPTGLAMGRTPGPSGRRSSIRVGAGDVPSVIGPYHLLQPLGEGGMGLVYFAEQREPIVRRVALKLIKPGMDTREVLARFEAERQALALMDHPNIARVLDAGLGPEQRPYFVMEYVAGVPITDYCDRHRLRNAERLQIFLQVCAALQHAHQKGVIHRDLKPSNILVAVQDGKAVPKVIDFGIAKATRQGSAERAAFTQLGMLIGTPEYMSPEQAEASGLAVDTTTDIYSLGVILYELLTGVLPFDGETLRRAGYFEMHRIIREQDPPKPSTRVGGLGAPTEEVVKHRQTTAGGLGKELRGALDAITMKAMEKDRTRRYASASEFAADIARYLNGEAVVARPASVMYRARKFVRRHRVGVAAGVLVLAALVVGLTLATVFYVKSERARQQAEEQAYEATIAAADSLSGAGQQSLARARLLQAPRRGWEWWHLFLKTDTSLASLYPHGAFISFPYRGSAFAFSADGQRVYFNTFTTLHEWDVNTYAAGPTRGGFGVILALGPGATFIVTRHESETDHALMLVEPASGRVVARLAGHTAPVECATVSRDGSRVASGATDRTVRTSDVTTGRLLAVIKTAANEPCPVTFSPDQRLVAFGERRAVQVSEAATGRAVTALQGSAEVVSALAFSHNGTRLAAGSFDGLIRTWTLPAGTPGAIMWGHRDQIIAVTFSPDDGQLASSAGDGTARVWDVTSGREAGRSSGFDTHETLAVAFEPQGSRLFVAGDELNLGATVRVWDRRTFGPWRTLPHDTLVNSVEFSRDGSQVATAGEDGKIKLWDVSSGDQTAVLSGHSGSVNALAWHPSEARFASGSSDKTVRVWDGRSGRLLATFPLHRATITEVAFSPAGTEVASAASDGLVVVCDGVSGQVLARQQWPESAQALAWDRTGKRLVIGFGNPSSGSDGRARLWDWKTGTVTASVDMPRRWPVRAIAVSPVDGRILIASGVDPQVWDSTLTRRLTQQPAGGWGLLAFFPDGLRFASTAADGMVRIWDAATLKPLLNLEIPGSYSRALAVSPDSRRVAAAVGKDVRVWDSVSAYHPDVSGLVSRLYEEPDFADAVSARIRGDDGLDPKLREAALRIVQSLGDQPARLEGAAWDLAKSPDHDAGAYTLAVRRAARAAQTLPWDPDILNTLGVAQYRAGSYPDAIATLERSAMLHRGAPHAHDLPFLAMAHQRLGEVAAARDALEKLRVEMKKADNADDKVLQAFLREAEALISGAGPTGKPAAGRGERT